MTNRRIVALTNLGVKNIHSGRYDSAILTLKHAVSGLSSRCLQSSLLDESGADYVDVITGGSSVTLAWVALQCMDETNFTIVSAHNTFTPFTSTFTPETVLDSVDIYAEIAMSIFFHLGLAHHLAGLFSRVDSQEHLEHALMSYKRSLALFRSTNISRVKCWATFVLGVFNNMGHIFRHLGECSQALQCIAHMEIVISSHVASDLTEEDDMIFSASILCGIRCHAAPCA